MDLILYAAHSDCETWRHEDANDAVIDLYEEVMDEVKAGDVLTIYTGKVEKPKASAFLPRLEEWMNENAWDNHGEIVDDWPNGTGIQAAIEDFVDKWAEENGKHPQFGEMVDIKPYQVLITKITDCDPEWEPVTP